MGKKTGECGTKRRKKERTAVSKTTTLWINIWKGLNRYSSVRFRKVNRKCNLSCGYICIRGFCTERTWGFCKKQAIAFPLFTEQDLMSSQIYFPAVRDPRASLHPSISTDSSQRPLFLWDSLEIHLFQGCLWKYPLFCTCMTIPLVASTITFVSATTGSVCNKSGPALFNSCNEQQMPSYPVSSPPALLWGWCFLWAGVTEGVLCPCLPRVHLRFSWLLLSH